ncbi:MAG TPA: TIGR00266 family protein [Clostridiaceae bacterium]|nr:TIGR00266 family protein [Clostridiaceae bacterium]
MKYEIKGTPLPVVICEIEPGESLITEGGSMSWMTPNMVMETVSGGLGKSLGRMFSGESLFLNKYTAEGGQGMIAFASSFPGQILPVNIEPNASMVAQKSAFLASQSGVELSIHFQKKVGAGFFGGEGFIMQKLSGQGLAFIEIDGSIVDYQLAAGQTMLIDNGYLAMMDASVTMDIQTVKGLKNKLLGGEGFFLTKVTGPGRVWIQTMPISSVAKSLAPFFPNRS